jgi:hypothetical protein
LTTEPSAGDETPDIVIRNEEDAYRILQLAARDQIGSYGRIIFDGWPSLSFDLRGEKFEQSLTSTVMKGLIEFQKAIYQSYAVARFSSPTKRLTEEEKDALELKVTVGRGSSAFEINFQVIAEKLIEHLGARMNPTEVLVTVVAIAAMYFGKSAYLSFLNTRKDARMSEISDETQRQTLQALQYVSEQETQRLAIIAEITAKDSRIEAINKLAHDAHVDVVKTLAAGTGSRIEGVDITPEVAEILTQNTRRRSSIVRIDGLYRLLKIDWTDPLKLKVKAANVESGLQIDAEVQDDSFEGRYKEALKSAEWSRSPIALEVHARRVGEDDYRDAVILTATPVSTPQM